MAHKLQVRYDFNNEVNERLKDGFGDREIQVHKHTPSILQFDSHDSSSDNRLIKIIGIKLC